MSTRYRSKIDFWFIVLIVALAFAHLWAAAKFITSGDWTTLTIFIPIAAVGLGLPVWVLLGTHYTVSSTSLDVRCGPFRNQVSINNIKELRPVRSVLSSPALSIDRIEIIYGNHDSVMISPVDRERFMAELELLRKQAH
jgi:hypothetical protein